MHAPGRPGRDNLAGLLRERATSVVQIAGVYAGVLPGHVLLGFLRRGDALLSYARDAQGRFWLHAWGFELGAELRWRWRVLLFCRHAFRGVPLDQLHVSVVEPSDEAGLIVHLVHQPPEAGDASTVCENFLTVVPDHRGLLHARARGLRPRMFFTTSFAYATTFPHPRIDPASQLLAAGPPGDREWLLLLHTGAKVHFLRLRLRRLAPAELDRAVGRERRPAPPPGGEGRGAANASAPWQCAEWPVRFRRERDPYAFHGTSDSDSDTEAGACPADDTVAEELFATALVCDASEVHGQAQRSRPRGGEEPAEPEGGQPGGGGGSGAATCLPELGRPSLDCERFLLAHAKPYLASGYRLTNYDSHVLGTAEARPPRGRQLLLLLVIALRHQNPRQAVRLLGFVASVPLDLEGCTIGGGAAPQLLRTVEMPVACLLGPRITKTRYEPPGRGTPGGYRDVLYYVKGIDAGACLQVPPHLLRWAARNYVVQLRRQYGPPGGSGEAHAVLSSEASMRSSASADALWHPFFPIKVAGWAASSRA